MTHSVPKLSFLLYLQRFESDYDGLPETLSSIDPADWELLICCEHLSGVDTLELARRLNFCKPTLLINTLQLGRVASYLKLVNHARAKVIVPISRYTLPMPGFIETSLEHLHRKSKPSILFVSGYGNAEQLSLRSLLLNHAGGLFILRKSLLKQLYQPGSQPESILTGSTLQMLPGNINAAVVRCDTLQINRPPQTVHLLHRVELADTLAAPQNALRTLFNSESRRRIIYRGFLSAVYLNDFTSAKSLLKCLVLENPFCWRLYKAKLGLVIIRKLKIQAAIVTSQMWPASTVGDSQFPSLLTLDYFGFQSNTGQLQGTRVVCQKTIHEKGHCVYGPDYPVTINAQMETGFSISASGEQSPDIVISLDIYDNANDEILVFRHLSGEELGDTKHTFWLRSPVTVGQCLEFRVFWHRLQDITIHSIGLVSRSSVIDSASS